MTRWGVFLLVVFLGLGLSRMPRAKAVVLATTVTALTIAYVMVKAVR
jgi:hypothetical protein